MLLHVALLRAGTAPTFFGTPQDKASLYEQRLRILEQRTSRHRLFCQPAVRQHGLDSSRCELTPIGELASSTCDYTHFVLASLSHVRGDECVLEDTSGSIDARLDNAQCASGLLTDGCVVLAEGNVQKDSRRNPLFYLSALGMPPSEQREDTLAAFPGIDLSGTGASTLQQSPADLQALQEEEKCEGGAVCIMSDVHVDDDSVHKRLLSFIDGCASSGLEPQVIALLGNLSRSGDLVKMRQGLFTLGEGVVAEARKRLPGTTFVIVPGPNDFVPCDTLPFPPLLDLLQSALREGFASTADDEKPQNVVFATNPVKMRALTHEICLLRLDLQATARCHCVRQPVEEDIADDEQSSNENAETKRLRHLCATLVRQAHMCPLPLDAQPIAWSLDGAMSLYPAPHGLAISDSSELQAATNADDVAACNPGSFAQSGEFAMYRIPERVMELCQVDVPNEEDLSSSSAIAAVVGTKKANEAVYNADGVGANGEAKGGPADLEDDGLHEGMHASANQHQDDDSIGDEHEGKNVNNHITENEHDGAEVDADVDTDKMLEDME